MPRLTDSTQTLPTPDEFRKALRESMEQYDPVDELLWLQRELGELEQKYGMTSEDCFRRFHEGQMGDDPEIFNWVGLYKGFQHLKSVAPLC